MATTIPTPSPKPVTEPPKPYTFHPYADIFPLLEGPAFDALVEDIRERGQQEPIWLYEGKILDGRNRYRALQQLGREPTKVQTYTGDDPIGFVLSANLHRRHLNESQRAMVAGKLTSLSVGANQHTKEGTSIDVASKLLNVGRASIDRARKVLSIGDPALVQDVEQGNVSVGAAAQQASASAGGTNSTDGRPRKNRSDKVEELVERLVKELKEWKKENEDTAIAAAHNLVDQLKEIGRAHV